MSFKSKSAEKFTSISEVLKHQPDMPVATSRNRHWQGLTVDFHKPTSDFSLDAPALDHHVVIYTPYGSGLVTQSRGGEVHKSIVHAGSVIIMPAGNACLWQGSAPANIRLRIPLQVLAETAEQLGVSAEDFELRNIFNTRDSLIENLSRILLLELDKPLHPTQALISESAACALAAHLLRGYNVNGAQQFSLSDGIGARTLANVVSYIEEHTDEALSLEVLAHIAHVSRFHFSRLFKAGTGISPMTFVEQVRIRKAQELIRIGGLSLAEIAATVGFADQSHFTRRFRLHTGCTPAVFARDQSPHRLPH